MRKGFGELGKWSKIRNELSPLRISRSRRTPPCPFPHATYFEATRILEG
jgi:hypothetical protein